MAVAYYAVARAGLGFALVRGRVAPLWPATGLALAFLCWLGPRALSGVVLGAFFVNLPIGPSFPAVLAITAGNTLAPALSYLLLRRTNFHVELDRLRDVLATGHFLSTASVWWTGDAMGVLTVTPLLLVAPRSSVAHAGAPGPVA